MRRTSPMHHQRNQQLIACYRDGLLQDTVPDRDHGEWFGYLHRDGSVSSTLKGNMFKGPFHLPRMQLNAWKLLEDMANNEATTRQDPDRRANTAKGERS